jgi:hypothetical protein
MSNNLERMLSFEELKYGHLKENIVHIYIGLFPSRLMECYCGRNED